MLGARALRVCRLREAHSPASPLTRVAPTVRPDVVEPAAWPRGAWPRLPAPGMEACQMAARGNPRSAQVRGRSAAGGGGEQGEEALADGGIGEVLDAHLVVGLDGFLVAPRVLEPGGGLLDRLATELAVLDLDAAHTRRGDVTRVDGVAVDQHRAAVEERLQQGVAEAFVAAGVADQVGGGVGVGQQRLAWLVDGVDGGRHEAQVDTEPLGLVAQELAVLRALVALLVSQ